MKKRKTLKNRFENTVAIVTGGSSGIGRAIVEELCKEGASVTFTGISDIGYTTEKEMKQAGYKREIVSSSRQVITSDGKLSHKAISSLKKKPMVELMMLASHQMVLHQKQGLLIGKSLM